MLPRLAIGLLLHLALLPGSDGAEIRITGLPASESNELRAIIEGPLEFVRTRPAIPSRADDAAFLLEEELRRHGYNDPRVTASIPSASLIVLTVDAGRAATLGEVTARGAPTLLEEELIDQFRNVHKPVDGPILLGTPRVPYLARRTPEGLNNARLLLQSKGYWDAEVTLASERINPATGATDVVLQVRPGPLFTLLPPRVLRDGSRDAVLEERLSGLAGEPSTTENISLARGRVERTYRGSGYQNATILMLASHEAGRTQLTFEVTPGIQYTTGSVFIDTDGETRQQRLDALFDDLPGQLYDNEEVNRRVRKLLNTGAFKGIEVEEHPNPNGTLDLTLHAREGKPDGYYVYGGAGSYEGFIIGAGYYHRNLFDNLWQFTSMLEYSGLGLLGEARLTDPFFLNSDLAASARLFGLTRAYDGYTKHEAGLSADLTWKVTDHYKLTFDAQTSYVAVDSDGIPKAELGPTDYALQTIGVVQSYDRRDDPVLPMDGFYAELDTDFGFASGGGGVGFFRNEGKVSYYKTLTDEINIALGFRGGIVMPSEDGADFPIDLRFFNGGASTVRSFPERELGPKASSGDPLGGEAYWAASAEYIQTIAGPVRAVAFFDAGALDRSFKDFGASDIKYAVGLGIRLDLPIGPVRFEYGHALSPDSGDPSGAFHFAIGTAF